MKSLKSLVLSLAVIIAAATEGPTAQAQSAWFALGAHVGYDTRLENYYIGGNSWFRLGDIAESHTLLLNANLNLYPGLENQTLYTVNAHATLGLADQLATVIPFAGAGVGFQYSTVEGGDTETNAGLNLTTGLLVQFGDFRPFLQGTLTISEKTAFRIHSGLSFGL